MKTRSKKSAEIDDVLFTSALGGTSDAAEEEPAPPAGMPEEGVDFDFPEPIGTPPPYAKDMAAAGKMDGWKPAAEVFDCVDAVRTIFPDFNRAVRVGGCPTRRIITVHGPTHGGKTAFVLGLVKSFVDVGFLGGYVDAEFTLGKEFAEEMVRDLTAKPNFVASRPKSYEETIEKVNEFLQMAIGIKKKHPEFRCCLVIDSINKLVPEKELKKILDAAGEMKKDGAEQVAKGHHGMIRAALNQAWLDQLVPKVNEANCALIIIAQEREEKSDSFYADDDNFTVKGGAALIFDASLACRVLKSSPVLINPSGDKKNENIAGFKHRVRIWKSKVGHMDGRWTDAYFHVSNGKGVSPKGLDTSRDAFHAGVDLGVINKSSSWYSFDKSRFQGEPKMVEALNRSPGLRKALFEAIAAKIDEMDDRDEDAA